MAGHDVKRLMGTLLVAIVTVTTYAAGLWMAWEYLYSMLPTPFGIIALAGSVLAPVQLVRELLDADRNDREKREKSPEIA